MSIKFYAYPKCSTCNQAQSFLNKKKIAYDAIDITQSPPSMDELKSMLSHVDGNLRRLFNVSRKVYREMKLGDKLDSLSENDALKLLASNGMLVKRPCLMIEGKASAIGFKEDEWKAIL